MLMPFVGGSYEMEAVTFDAQRTINMYPLIAESNHSKSVTALRSFGGLTTFATAGTGFIRGALSISGRAFVVSGNGFYEVNTDGTTTLHGTLDTNFGSCQLETNPTQVMITDGTYGYIFTKSTDTFAKITDVDFPTPADLTYQDGYFIVAITDTNQYAISGLNDGTSWDALDRKTVESSPDNLVAVYSDSSNLWCIGEDTTEVHYNSGNATFPFERIAGAIIEVGCVSADTVQEIDNSVYWLATDKDGDAYAVKTQGYNVQRITTQAIERRIDESPNFIESSSWTYHERTHGFYNLNVKGLDTTLCYDVSTGQWVERSYRNPITNAKEQHLACCHIFFNKKHLVGARNSGKIYEMSLDVYTDDGDPIVRERVSPHIDEEKQWIDINSFELDMETGIGLQSGQGSDPQVMFQYSVDGGRTWSSELWRSFGKVGKYKTRVKWDKLQGGRDTVFKINVSDPVFVQINEAIVNGV